MLYPSERIKCRAMQFDTVQHAEDLKQKHLLDLFGESKCTDLREK